jgi:hypothetical protein
VIRSKYDNIRNYIVATTITVCALAVLVGVAPACCGSAFEFHHGLVAPKGPNLNLDNAVSRFGLYEININGALHKIGKADLDRITKSSGLPTRLPQQVRKQEKVFGKGDVIGKVVEDLGSVTTAAAKAAEHARILKNFAETGFLLIGNWKSFKL